MGLKKSLIQIWKSFKSQIQISNGFEIQNQDFKWHKFQIRNSLSPNLKFN